MSDVFSILLIFQLVVAAVTTYLLILSLAAVLNPLTHPSDTERIPSFQYLILVPAHNEEALLPDCLSSIFGMDYPPNCMKVVVVADNCTDQTPEIARREHARVLERINSDQRGKGYALNWALDQLQQEVASADAVVFFDADTVVSPDFLSVISRHLRRGERVIQSFYSVRNPDQSWMTALRYAAFSVLHYLRPSGRMALGGSVGLKGNGMVFASDLFVKHRWSASVTEDIELHMVLLLAGEVVSFAPQAIVWGEMPQTVQASTSQVDRWESGRLSMLRRYLPPLIRSTAEAVIHRRWKTAFQRLDAMAEHVIPPYSILVFLTLMTVLLSSVWLVVTGVLPGEIDRQIVQMGWFCLLFGAMLLSGQFAYLFTGLYLVSAPAVVYRYLIFAPVFAVWKAAHYVKVLFGRGPSGWIRTVRNEG